MVCKAGEALPFLLKLERFHAIWHWKGHFEELCILIFLEMIVYIIINFNTSFASMKYNMADTDIYLTFYILTL